MQETGGLKLSDILDGTLQLQDLQDDDELSDPEREETNELPVPVVANGFCVECEDQPAQIHCEQCTDDFCEVCYSSQHRKGTRKKHTGRQLFNGALKTPKKDAQKSGGVAEPIADDNLVDDSGNDDMLISPASTVQSNSVGSYFLERAKYIPLRLTLHERKLLRLLEAALNVSEYTDKIDVIVYSSKTKRIVAQIRELCAILSGLVMASDYRVGQELFQDRNFEDNADFLSALYVFFS